MHGLLDQSDPRRIVLHAYVFARRRIVVFDDETVFKDLVVDGNVSKADPSGFVYAVVPVWPEYWICLNLRWFPGAVPCSR